MRRPDNSEPWRLLIVGDDARVAELNPSLRTSDAADAATGDEFTAQGVRQLLVDGIAREAMAQRIQRRLAETMDSAHRRYTRRAYLELQGRRRSPLPLSVPPTA